MPDAIGDNALTKSSTHGYPDSDLGRWADKRGIGADGIDLAIATTVSDSPTDYLNVQATRVHGADASEIRDLLLSMPRPPSVAAPTADVVGGKRVTVLSSAVNGQTRLVYFYPSGDVLYAIETLDPSIAAKFLAAVQ